MISKGPLRCASSTWWCHLLLLEKQVRTRLSSSSRTMDLRRRRVLVPVAMANETGLY